MIHESAIEYIKAQLAAGIDRDTIRANLVSNGWNEQDVDDSLNAALNAPKDVSKSAAKNESSPNVVDPFSAFEKNKEQNSPTMVSGVSEGSSTVSPTSVAPATSTLLGVGDLLGQTMDLFKSRFKVVFIIQLFPLLIALLVTIVGSVTAVAGAWLGIGSLLSSSPTALFGTLGIFFVIMLILGLINAFVGVWATGATIYAIHNTDANIKQAFSATKRKVIPLFWISLLIGFSVMVGSLALLIPGLILAIKFSFSLYVAVIEDQKGSSALLKSREYVNNFGLAVFIRLFVFGLVMFGLYLGVGLLFGGLGLAQSGPVPLDYSSTSPLEMDIQAQPSANASDSLLTLLGSLVNLALQAVLAPIGLIYGYLIFKNLREIKPQLVNQPPAQSKLKAFIVFSGVLGPLFIVGAILVPILVLSTLNPSRQLNRAKDAQLKASVSKVQLSLDSYRVEEGIYPADLSYLQKTSPTDLQDQLSYRQLDNGEDYELCVTLSEEGLRCLKSGESLLRDNPSSLTTMEINDDPIKDSDTSDTADSNELSTMMDSLVKESAIIGAMTYVLLDLETITSEDVVGFPTDSTFIALSESLVPFEDSCSAGDDYECLFSYKEVDLPQTCDLSGWNGVGTSQCYFRYTADNIEGNMQLFAKSFTNDAVLNYDYSTDSFLECDLNAENCVDATESVESENFDTSEETTPTTSANDSDDKMLSN
ncbi:MAG: hypothetical protein ACOZAO_05280 [Patescibacteria group bacterium]